MESKDSKGSGSTGYPTREEDLLLLPQASDSFDFLLFRGLKALCPDMTIMDVVVCREVYTNLQDEHPSMYDEIISRLVDEKLKDIPDEFWREYFDEAQLPLEASCVIDSETGGLLETKELRLFPDPYGEFDIKRAMWKAKERGYIDFKIDGWGNSDDKAGDGRYYFIPYVSVALRDDIFDALSSVDVTDFATWCGYDFNVEDMLKTREEELAELDRRLVR
jgi:hypothetical protein